MSEINYCGRIDYTCPKPQEKELPYLIKELIVSVYGLIKAIGENLNKRFKLWLRT
jgi:hypothetical protein